MVQFAAKSREQFLNNSRRLDTDQPLVEPLEREDETISVKAKQVHDRMMQVVDMHPLIDDVEAEIIAECDSYRRQLLLALEEKTKSIVMDPGLDILILSLIDKLETLEWVLAGSSEVETTYVTSNNSSH